MESETLEEWASEVLGRLPTEPDDDPFLLSAESLPRPLPVKTDRQVLRRSGHLYDTFPVDAVWWYGDKDSLGSLGVLLFSLIFHGLHSPLQLELANTASDIRSLVIDGEALRRDTSYPALRVTPWDFDYWAADPTRHPWFVASPPDPTSLPYLRLTNAEDLVVRDEDLPRRDRLHGFGSLAGTARFAELLLDLSRPSTKTHEVALESEAGFRGVAPASAEIRLWMPGSDGWMPEWFGPSS